MDVPGDSEENHKEILYYIWPDRVWIWNLDQENMSKKF